MQPARSVVMYSRRRCGLCDEAREAIVSERRRGEFPFEEIFIDGDDDLEREYGLRVPVVLVDGVEHFEAVVDPAALRRLLSST
jgi:glutaredoxin